jgi:pimeloyl-ACP methyl ester carboxylesterase
MSHTLEHRQLQANGVELHLACQGEGPLVLMCHGYPGLWYSWRHQIQPVAEAGFRAVAMDMRGYGASSRPLASSEYGFDRLAGDLLAVLDYFESPQAVLFGHDFGANLAWHMGIWYPERIRAIAPLCVPYDMQLAGGSDQRPSELYAAIAREHFFHMHYYQSVGVAERHLVGREREFLTKLFWALSADGELLDWENFPTEGTHYIDVLAEPASELPWAWLSVEDMDYYVEQYLSAGPDLAFIGGINGYRAMDRNWELQQERAHAGVPVPTLFVGGEEDPVLKLAGDDPLETTRNRVKDLRGLELLPGAGHFIQQERPDLLNPLLLAFLRGL